MPKKTGPNRAGGNNRRRPAAAAGSRGAAPRGARPPGRGMPANGRTAVRREVPSAPAPGLRGAVERRSYPVLLRLSRMPKLVPALAFLAIAAAGLLLPPPFGPALLGVVVVLMVWLTYLSWPVTTPAAKALRILLITLVAAGALAPAINA